MHDYKIKYMNVTDIFFIDIYDVYNVLWYIIGVNTGAQ